MSHRPLCQLSLWRPALEYYPPDQGDEEDCEPLDGVCDNTAYEYEATKDAENDRVEGPRPVRPGESILATTKDEYSKGS